MCTNSSSTVTQNFSELLWENLNDALNPTPSLNAETSRLDQRALSFRKVAVTFEDLNRNILNYLSCRPTAAQRLILENL